MSSSSTAGKAGRRERSEQRWKEETTAAPPPVRQRARHLEAEEDVYSQNAWDDVEISEEEVAAAEKIIAASTVAAQGTAENCVSNAAALWDKHYVDNLRNYHDRNYLQNEFPSLVPPDGKGQVLVLETGCGVGNTLLPLLALSPRVMALGCDHAAAAVDRANERLARERQGERGFAFVWDIADAKTASGAPPPRDVDAVLAIFTLSALSPTALPRAFTNLAACLKPGGRLLLRDYGRLDLKQLKFSKASQARLGTSPHGCEWYRRGDGTTALFLTTEAISALASEAGLEVEALRYDRRLVVNRAEKTRMQRVWVVATLRKPHSGAAASTSSSTALGGNHGRRQYWAPLLWASALFLGLALARRWHQSSPRSVTAAVAASVATPLSIALGKVK